METLQRVALPGALLAASTMLSGCLVGPHYQRPAVNAPPVYRDANATETSPTTSASASSVGDLKWSEVFKDEKLEALVSEALKNNYDVGVAAKHVLEQQAQVGITRSQSLPSANGGSAYNAVGLPSGLLGNSSSPKYYGGGFTASAIWNIDFWGLYRRQNEAERAQLLETEWARRAVLSSVVINVATTYIQ
jgi:multidrug efflux system outer membrane protein